MPLLDREMFDCFPWEETALGPRKDWPDELHFVSDFLLCSKQPMFVLWGPQKLFIHNGPYQQAWGVEDLGGMGRPIAEVAPVIWAELRGHVEQVFGGDSFMERDFPIADPLSGSRRYFDFSYTPLRSFDLSQVIGRFALRRK